MANFIERIGDASTLWFDGLTDREKKLMLGMLVGFCIVLTIGTLYLASSKLSSKNTLLSRNKALLSEVLELEEEFLFAKEKNESILRSINRNEVSLFTLIQSITSRLGLSVKDLNEQKRPLPKSKIVEVKVVVNLSKLSIDKVSALIEAIEAPENEAQVKITKLKISNRRDEPDLLDLQMTVSTWKSS